MSDDHHLPTNVRPRPKVTVSAAPGQGQAGAGLTCTQAGSLIRARSRVIIMNALASVFAAVSTDGSSSSSCRPIRVTFPDTQFLGVHYPTKPPEDI